MNVIVPELVEPGSSRKQRVRAALFPATSKARLIESASISVLDMPIIPIIGFGLKYLMMLLENLCTSFSQPDDENNG
jgi:hypothetical protein